MREMKDSGIEWIGEMPRNWEVSRIKYVCNNRSEKAQFDHEEDSYLGLENVVGFSDKIIETDTTYTDGYYDIYKSGDVLFNKLRPYLGKVIIAPYDGFCTGEFIRLYNYQGDNRFLRYWMIDEQFIKEVDNSTYGAKMPRANPDFILNMPIAIVSSQEQHRISTFLDAKCSEIDALAADIQSQIDTLEQYKRSVITEAVTKGLDRNVEMKESGIEWIGEIPKEWRIFQIKFLCKPNSIKIGPFGSSLSNKTFADAKYNVYGQANLVSGDFSATKNTVTEETFNNLRSYEVIPDDICVSMMGTIGKCRIVPEGISQGIMDSHLIKLRVNETLILPEFFTYVYDKDLGGICYAQMQYEKSGSIMDGLNTSIVKKLYMPIPSIAEQRVLISYLDAKCSEIDDTISLKKQQVETLEKLKKSAIYEYVTGKKEVPA